MPRKSSLELLRIMAMLAIVCGHFLSQSGLGDRMEDASQMLAAVLGSGVRIGVNVFLVLGVWFMVDAKFKAERIVRLYLEVVFYSVPITCCMLLAGHAGGARNVIQGLLPFFGRSVWFASAYISLIALAPFLNRAFLLPRKAQQALLGLLVVFFCLVPTIPCSTPLDYLADFTWFCVVYLLVGIWKRSNVGARFRGKWRFLLAGTVLYLALVAARCLPQTQAVAGYWIVNIKSLPNFICAVFVFVGFLRLDIGSSRCVNMAARSVFAVYIIHQVPAFIHFQWTTIFRADRLIGATPFMFVCGTIAIALAVFTGASIIDFFRWRYLEPLYMSARPIKWLVSKIANFYDRAADEAGRLETT